MGCGGKSGDASSLVQHLSFLLVILVFVSNALFCASHFSITLSSLQVERSYILDWLIRSRPTQFVFHYFLPNICTKSIADFSIELLKFRYKTTVILFFIYSTLSVCLSVSQHHFSCTLHTKNILAIESLLKQINQNPFY